MSRSRKGSLVSERSYTGGKKKYSEEDDLETRGAYLRVVESLDDSIHTRQELTQVLQYAGKNPTGKQINAIWSKSGGGVTYAEFCKLAAEIKSTSKSQLMSAFRKIDINGDGFISESELYKVLTSRGEKMTQSEVKKILDMSDSNKDGKLDYEEFSAMMLSTSNRCKHLNMQRLEQSSANTVATSRPTPAKRSSTASNSGLLMNLHEHNESKENRSLPHTPQTPARPASASTVKKEAISIQRLDDAIKVTCSPSSGKTQYERPKMLKGWNHISSKGLLALEEGGKIISHIFTLELPFASNVWLTIKPYSPSNSEDKPKSLVDMGVFIIRESEDGETTTVAQTDLKDSTQWCWRGDLRSGSYKIVPFTSGCRLKPRAAEAFEDLPLVRKDQHNEIQLSKSFRSALSELFDLCDLDGNGLLSRSEFNFYQLITSLEEVDDDAWQVVLDKLETENEQITMEGFIHLHLLQAQEDGLDSQTELMDIMKCMGYNGNLEMDQACPFQLNIFTKDCKGTLQPNQLSTAQDNEMEKAFVDSIVAKNFTHKINSMEGLVWYIFANEFYAASVIENKTSRAIQCQVDCSKSRNCMTHKSKDVFKLQVPAHNKVIVDQAIAASLGEWCYHCSVADGTINARRSSLRKSVNKKESNLLSIFD